VVLRAPRRPAARRRPAAGRGRARRRCDAKRCRARRDLRGIARQVIQEDQAAVHARARVARRRACHRPSAAAATAAAAAWPRLAPAAAAAASASSLVREGRAVRGKRGGGCRGRGRWQVELHADVAVGALQLRDEALVEVRRVVEELEERRDGACELLSARVGAGLQAHVGGCGVRSGQGAATPAGGALMRAPC
jgi:hypothetical protein